jgi:hypothetical protein
MTLIVIIVFEYSCFKVDASFVAWKQSEKLNIVSLFLQMIPSTVNMVLLLQANSRMVKNGGKSYSVSINKTRFLAVLLSLQLFNVLDLAVYFISFHMATMPIWALYVLFFSWAII